AQRAAGVRAGAAAPPHGQRVADGRHGGGVAVEPERGDEPPGRRVAAAAGERRGAGVDQAAVLADGPHPPADRPGRFEDPHRPSLLRQRVRGGQPGEARAHHDDVRQGDVEREAAAFRDGARHDAAPPTRAAPPTGPVTAGKVTVTWWAGVLTPVAGTAPSGPSSAEFTVRLLSASGRRNDRRAPVPPPQTGRASCRATGQARSAATG